MPPSEAKEPDPPGTGGSQGQASSAAAHFPINSLQKRTGEEGLLNTRRYSQEISVDKRKRATSKRSPVPYQIPTQITPSVSLGQHVNLALSNSLTAPQIVNPVTLVNASPPTATSNPYDNPYIPQQLQQSPLSLLQLHAQNLFPYTLYQ